MKQYISDIITENEICQWQPGNRILICSQTGTGKSQMIKDGLYEYAKKYDRKILLLSNRNILKKQNEEELKDSKSDIITLKNYQTLESSIIQGNEISDLFKKYDYIIFDECHYILSDSTFNLNTDILLSQLKNPNKNSTYVFITATPEAILHIKIILNLNIIFKEIIHT
jgi:superfamily II DNA or RNA helicase